MRLPLASVGLVLTSALVLTATPACSAVPVSTAQTAQAVAAAADYPDVTVTGVVTTNLQAPWGLAFLPDGSALVTERDTGRIKRVQLNGRHRATLVGTVRGVMPNGEGGLHGIAVPPGPNPTFLFVYFTAANDNRVVRIAWDGKRLGKQTPIVTGIPKGGIHNGGRLLIGPNSTLFIATGETGNPQLAQAKKSLAGKVLRVTFAGKPAPGNPFPGSRVYTLGHRNVQGLALDSSGRVWASEFGQSDVDELNLLRPGGNYGWPAHEGAADDDRYVNPFAQWSPTSTASPSGIAIVDDVAFVASLRGQTLWVVPLSGSDAGEPKRAGIAEFGRLRNVAAAPDGSLWLVTNNTDGRGSPRSNDDRIIRLKVTPR